MAPYDGRADTDKLIGALENLNVAQSADCPDGPMLMNKDNHQGRLTAYLLKVNGQHEEILQTFPSETQPVNGDCNVAARS